jgi:amino acid adenylation domain-containing protein
MMPKLLHRMVEEAALRHPDAVAVRCDGATLSWGDLAHRANGLARVLLETGMARRDRVAVLLAKGPRVPEAFYGVLAAGGTLVPIDPRSPAEQVIRILRATGVTRLVTEPGMRDLAATALAGCPAVVHVVGLQPEDAVSKSCVPWSEVLPSGQAPAVDVIEQDPVYILHTSGSTGIPKLILHTHHSAMSFVDWAVAEYGITREDRLTNASSHHTCFATFDYYAAARAGAATVILTPSVLMMPGSLAELIERERVSVWYSVPTALVQLSLRGNLESRDLRSMRWVLFAGETFPAKHLHRVMRQIPSARFSHVYGSTEVNVCTYYHLPPVDQLVGPLPIGKACSNTRTLVVDDQGRPVSGGEPGELIVGGSTVMSGYWEEPERNRAVLLRRPAPGGFEDVYFRTGDRVRVLEDGQLAFVTRADRQIKVRGYRVELEEVEAALLSLASVDEAAAFAVPDAEGSLAIQAAVVASGEGAGERDILAGLRRILPPQAIPEKIHAVDEMPRTPTGKVDAKVLAARLTQEQTQHGR